PPPPWSSGLGDGRSWCAARSFSIGPIPAYDLIVDDRRFVQRERRRTMPFRRRRPLARAAVVGGTAYLAGRAGARAGAADTQEDEAAYAAPPPEAAAEVAPGEDHYAKLGQRNRPP